MGWFDPNALNPGVRRREVLAWASYDFANSGYTTVVLTAVFNAYFVSVVAAGADWGTLAWTSALAVSNLLVMVTMPALGARADHRGRKKPGLAFATLGCVIGTAGLAWVGKGDVALAVLLIIVSNYCYALGETFCGAFLPELSRPEALGRVSGWGWSFGYLGGMLALGVSLGWVVMAQSVGRSAAEFVPVTMWITAGIYAVAAWLRERAVPRAGDGPSWRSSLLDLRASYQRTVAFVDFRRLLLMGVAYQAGIAVIIALAAVYAEQVMAFQQQETMLLIFLVNIAAALGAFGFGYAQDRIGHKAALALTLLAWIGMVLLAGLGTSVWLFWIAATLAGLCMGSSQSCGRTLVAMLAPADRMTEFFGLWSFATRLAAVIGPLTYGLVTWGTGGNHRLAILLTGLFFVVGLIVLATVNLARGQAKAQEFAASPARVPAQPNPPETQRP